MEHTRSILFALICFLIINTGQPELSQESPYAIQINLYEDYHGKKTY